MANAGTKVGKTNQKNEQQEEPDAEEEANTNANVTSDYSVWKEIIILHTRAIWINFVVISTVTLQCEMIFYDISFRGRTAFQQQSNDLSEEKVLIDVIYAFDVISAIIYKKWNSFSSTRGQPTRPIASLIVDVISLLPLDWVYRFVTNGEDLRTAYLLSTNDLLRTYRLFSFFNATRNGVGQRKVFVRILEFLILLFLMAGAAVAGMIHLVDMVKLDLNWMKIIEIRSSYPTSEFEWCIVSYYVMITQISGHSLPEAYPGIYSFVFTMIVLVSLWILQAFEIAYLTDIILKQDYSRSLFHREMSLVISYLNGMKACKETREKVKKCCNYFWKTQGNSEFKITKFGMYPSIFLKECALELAWDAYKHSHLFRDQPIPFLRNLAILFSREYYRPGEVIIEKYDQKSKLIYVVSGVVQFLSEEDNKSPIMSFSGGTILCETTLILGHRALCNLVARTEVELHVLHRDKFVELMVYKYQSLYRTIQSRVRFRYWKAMRMVTIGATLQKNKSHIVSVSACTDVAWLKQTLTILQNSHNRIHARKDKRDVQTDAIFATTDYRYTFANLDMLVISDDFAIMRDQVCLNNGQIPWIFNPQSSILDYWKGFVLGCCLTLTFIIPACASQPSLHVTELTFFVNILCPVYLVDLIITSSTAIHENDVVHMDIIDIISRRMHKVSYWADIVAAFPADWILIMFGSKDEQTLAYCRVNRLVKIYKFKEFFSILETRMILSSYKIRVMRYTFYMMILTYVASTCVLLATCPNGECVPTGALQTYIASSSGNLEGHTVTAAFFYASQMLVGIGTDVIVPRLVIEYSVNIILLVVGAAVFNYVVSSVAASQILEGFTKSWLRFNTMNIALMLDMHNVSKSIQKRVFQYLDMEWQENKAYGLTFNRNIFGTMTPKLRKELNAERLGSLVRKVDLFQEMEEDCITEICSVCKVRLLPPREVLGYRGNECRIMYILEKGHCEGWRNVDMTPIHIRKGRGLYVLEMLCNLKNSHTVTTVTHVSIVQITMVDLMHVLAKFPTEKSVLMEVVNRFKKSPEFKMLLSIQRTLPGRGMLKEVEVRWERVEKLAKAKANPKTKTPGKNNDVAEEHAFKETVLMCVVYSKKCPAKGFFIRRFFLAKCTINPNGRFIKTWEVVRGVCSYTLIMIYSADAVLSQIIPKVLMTAVVSALNFVMLIDMYVRLHVQYYNSHRVVVTHPLSTAINYIKTGLIVDVVAVFPLEHFFISQDSEDEKIIWLCRLNRLLMAHQMIGSLRHYYSWPYISKYVNCVMFVPMVVLIAHVFACGLLLELCDLGYEIESSEKFHPGIYCSPEDVQFRYDVTDPITPLVMYVYSLLYVFATITKIGVVNIKPVRYSAILCVLVMTFTSFLLLMVVTTYIVSTISRRDATFTAYQEQMTILMSFLKEKKVSTDFRSEVVKHFETFWILRRGTSSMKQLQLFPAALRKDVLWSIYGPSLTKSPGFSKKNESFFRALFNHIDVNFYSKGSEIMTINLVHSRVYFIHWGWAEAFGPDGTRIAVLGCGSIFGNFTGSSTMRQTCSIVTRTHMEAITLKSDDFFSLMMRHEDIRKRFLFAALLNTDYLKADTEGEEVEAVSQAKKKPPAFILLPNTPLVETWEIFSVLFSCYLAFAMCIYDVAVVQFTGYWMVLLYVVDLAFLLKTVLVFFTAYEDELGDYVLDKNLIAKRFRGSKFGLYFHIFTILPLEVFCLFGSQAARLHALAWLRMNRVPRLILFVNYFRTACNRLDVNMSGRRICYAVVVLVSLLHTTACLTILTETATNDGMTILEGLGVYVENFYSVSLMFAAMTPRIVPKNSREALYFVFIFLVFYVTHAILLGEVCAVVDVNQFIMNEYERWITFFRDRVARMDLTYVLRTSAWSYGSRLWDLRRGQQTPRLISEAPIYLRYAVSYQMYSHHLLDSEIFGNLHEDFIRQLTFHFKDSLFFPGDTIVNLGDVDETMYFIDKGAVEAHDSDLNSTTRENQTRFETQLIGPGQPFGVIQGLYEGIPHTANYTAKTVTHIIYLYRLDWIYLLKYFPVSTVNLYRSATRIIRSEGMAVQT